MKLIITESKFKQMVISYLDRLYTPDFGFDVDYNLLKDKYGAVNFDIDDNGAYEYWFDLNDNGAHTDTLWIFGRVSNALNSAFGDNWVDIFVEWFKERTGLNVDKVHYYDNGERRAREYD